MAIRFAYSIALMGLGRRDAIRMLGLEASTLRLIYILRFWTLDAIDLWGAIGSGHHDDLVGSLARSGSSPGKLSETISRQERTPSCTTELDTPEAYGRSPSLIAF
jgi:hypothetical protein